MQKISKQQKNLIIGTLLGDAILQTENKGLTWCYRTLQKADDLEYIMFKYNILKNLCQTEPIYQELFNKRTNKTYKRYYFNSLTNSSFRFYSNLFYKNIEGKFIKRIPKNIEKFLNPEVIAYWYMDNGSIKWLGHSNGMKICTENFSYICVKRLQKAISKKFNINLKLIKVKKLSIIIGYRLYINENNSKAFIELIEPYIIESMKYKVSDGNRNNL